MNQTRIDWDEAWRQAQDARSRCSAPDYWTRRAPSFARHTSQSHYTAEVLRLVQPEPWWSVLDVGCGAGTLAVPLARRVSSVTALDFSPGMLDLLGQRCREEGIDNVTPVLGAWEDDWEGLGLGAHDLAIASRSMSVRELRPAVEKLDRAARRRVFITAPIGDGPLDRRMFEAVGRSFHPAPDYVFIYNLLHQMGIYAHVAIVSSDHSKSFGSREEALSVTGAVLDDLTAGEIGKLNAYLAERLVLHDGRWHLQEPRMARWAFMWWDKENSK